MLVGKKKTKSKTSLSSFLKLWENIITLHSLVSNKVLQRVHRKLAARRLLAE